MPIVAEVLQEVPPAKLISAKALAAL